jgi:hypothetical protein
MSPDARAHAAPLGAHAHRRDLVRHGSRHRNVRRSLHAIARSFVGALHRWRAASTLVTRATFVARDDGSSVTGIT